MLLDNLCNVKPYIVGEWVTLQARAETERIVSRIEKECMSCYETAEAE
jgi:hypothetical protein